MKVLFVHQNFPAQYVHLAPALAADRDNDVVAIAMRDFTMPGVRVFKHSPTRSSSPGIHSLATDFEAKVIRGESAAQAALRLKSDGFSPDVICGHPGWGETLFLKDVWPDARLLTFVEFFYNATGSDVDFDPEFPQVDTTERLKVRSKNAGLNLAFAASNWFVSPTRWQARQIPSAYHNRTSVIHDGIDTDRLKPNSKAYIRLGNQGIRAVPGDEIVTFVNRNLEPYRGYHSFMRSLPEIMRRRPKARVVIVGGNGVSYGAKPPPGRTYREIYLDEVKPQLDMSRIHFVGSVPYEVYISLLQVSAAHVYLTYPFVLSWSLLESMALGCAIVGSSTPPVQEIMTHGENGLLVDFFSPDQIADAVVKLLDNPRRFDEMRRRARETAVSHFDLRRICLPQHLALIRRVAEGEMDAVEDPLASTEASRRD